MDLDNPVLDFPHFVKRVARDWRRKERKVSLDLLERDAAGRTQVAIVIGKMPLLLWSRPRGLKGHLLFFPNFNRQCNVEGTPLLDLFDICAGVHQDSIEEVWIETSLGLRIIGPYNSNEWRKIYREADIRLVIELLMMEYQNLTSGGVSRDELERIFGKNFARVFKRVSEEDLRRLLEMACAKHGLPLEISGTAWKEVVELFHQAFPKLHRNWRARQKAGS